jgi:hypothetical protein
VVSVTDRGTTTDTPATTDVQADPCVGLGEYCHDVDPGSGPLHDCHEGAHDSTPAWCAANAVRCRQLCTEARNPCVGLGEYCHDVDPGSGPIHDCHEGAHDSTPAWCAANAVRCRQLCTEARDASAPTDASAHAHDGSADGGAHQH